MSGRVNKLQNALTVSSVDVIETVPAVTGLVKDTATESRRILRSGLSGVAHWCEDWEDSVVDSKAMKKLERAFGLRQRARALELEEAAFNALPKT